MAAPKFIGLPDTASDFGPVDLLAWLLTLSRDVTFLTAVVAGLLAWIGTVLGDVIFLTTVATSTLLAVRAILGHVIFRLTDLASTTWLLAFLSTVSDTMTFLATQMAQNLGLLFLNLVLWASLGLVADFIAVFALVDTAVEGSTGIGKTGKVFLGSCRPLGDEGRTLSFVRLEVADSILLADFSLEVDVGPSITMILFLSPISV